MAIQGFPKISRKKYKMVANQLLLRTVVLVVTLSRKHSAGSDLIVKGLSGWVFRYSYPSALLEHINNKYWKYIMCFHVLFAKKLRVV
jgi:hypothetical protein